MQRWLDTAIWPGRIYAEPGRQVGLDSPAAASTASVIGSSYYHRGMSSKGLDGLSSTQPASHGGFSALLWGLYLDILSRRRPCHPVHNYLYRILVAQDLSRLSFHLLLAPSSVRDGRPSANTRAGGRGKYRRNAIFCLACNTFAWALSY